MTKHTTGTREEWLAARRRQRGGDDRVVRVQVGDGRDAARVKQNCEHALCQ